MTKDTRYSERTAASKAGVDPRAGKRPVKTKKQTNWKQARYNCNNLSPKHFFQASTYNRYQVTDYHPDQSDVSIAAANNS